MSESNRLQQLSSLGHIGNQISEDILSAGVSGDILSSIKHLTDGGTFRMITRNFEGVYNSFSQLKLYPLTLDDIAPLSILGNLSPPKPHIGLIDRKSRSNQSTRIWLRG